MTQAGRFGHHDSISIDFCLEVIVIGKEWDEVAGLPNDPQRNMNLVDRIARAMDSGPFITPEMNEVKDQLRRIQYEVQNAVKRGDLKLPEGGLYSSELSYRGESN